MQEDLHLGERGVSKIGKNCVWPFLYHYFCTKYKCMIKLIHLIVRNITFKIIHRGTGIGKPHRAYHNLTANQVYLYAFCLLQIAIRKEKQPQACLEKTYSGIPEYTWRQWPKVIQDSCFKLIIKTYVDTVKLRVLTHLLQKHNQSGLTDGL